MKDANKERNEEKPEPNPKRQEPRTVLNGIKTAIFDLDGTMYDKRGLARRMMRRLWWCLPLLTAERLARRNMHYVHFASGEEFFHYFFKTMARGHWWTASIASVWYNTVYMPTMVHLIAKYHCSRPEAVELMNECMAQGIQMAIYSDYGCVEDKLEALHMDASQFDLIVAAPELGSLKPSEENAKRVMEMLGADPATTLFVGDRDEKDGESARRVGARFYLIKN